MSYLIHFEMEKNKITKEDKKTMSRWITKNGACRFDTKNKDIILYDGGLFSIEKEKLMLPKIIGFKKLKDGNSQILFTRKKYPQEGYYALLWMSELDDTISYFQSMKRMLNKLGIRTSRIKKV